MTSRLAGICLLFVFLVTASISSAAAPSTASATTQSVNADPSTPRGALHLLAQALAAGDRAGVMGRLLAESEPEKQLASATADLAEASAALRKAAVSAFGESSAAPLGADLSASPEALKRIDAARVDQQGEKATVHPADSDGPPIVLLQREGVWRMPVSELLKDVESADVQRSIDAMNEQTKQMKSMSAEVAAGKFKSAVDARQELDKRIVQTALPKGTAATGSENKPK